MATPSDDIKRSLIHKILIGHYPVGSTLPSCRALAAELGINRNTASKIYQELGREGLVKAIRGRGVVVISQRGTGGAPVPGVRERLLTAAREARLMGMERKAFLEAAREVADELFAHQRPAIAFVECNEQDAEALGKEIEAALSLPVHPILVSALELAPESLLAGYDIVCTTLYHLLTVRRALGQDDDRLVAVHAPPDPDALLEIAGLDASTRLGIVCSQLATQQYMVTAVGMVHRGELTPCLLSDRQAVKALQGSVDVVVDVPSCHQEVVRLLPRMPVVTVGFRVDAKSLAPLRERLARYLSRGETAVS